MKTISVAALMMMAVGAAQAADLPRKMPVKAPPPAPVWNWTGFYIGAYYGTSIGHSNVTTSVTPGQIDLNDTGITAGGTLGYNWQFSPTGLLGIEADFGWLGTSRSFGDFSNVAVTAGVKTDWYGTVRGRLGYVTGPSLLYVTGGGAWVRLEETFGGSAVVGAAAVAPTTRETTEWGWTAGVGIETKLSRSWTAKTEYLYVDVGATDSYIAPTLVVQSATFDHQFHVIKTGLNYKFGEPFELPFLLAPLSSPQRWAGFYAGVNLGGGLSHVHTPTSTIAGGEADLNGAGFAGGGHLGYNMVLFSNWIVGIEGDIGYLGIRRSYADWANTGAPGALYQPGVDTNWYGTVRGRIGTSTGPAFLYVTGGFAAVNVENSITGGAGTFSIDGTRTGWTFGGGIETELGANWSARLESLYIDVGSDTVTAPNGTVEFKNRFQVVRAGLSYKFGGPAVVSARY